MAIPPADSFGDAVGMRALLPRSIRAGAFVRNAGQRRGQRAVLLETIDGHCTIRTALAHAVVGDQQFRAVAGDGVVGGDAAQRWLLVQIGERA